MSKGNKSSGKDNKNNGSREIFDYDSYAGSSKKNNKSKSGGRKIMAPKQKPPTLVPANENDRSEAKKTAKKQEKDSIENIKKMFDEALDESREDMAELTDELAVPEEPAANPEGLKRKLLFLFGIVITLLAIVGLYSTVVFTAGKIRDFADNTQQKNEFARFIYPIVICDPPPFNKTVKLRSDTLITASIWDIILYEDKSKYEADFDMMIVPELDVEQHGTKLFGSGLSFEHQSIIGVDVQFYYDESIKSYRIPSNPKYFTYSPYIEDITRVGERYTLTVGYVSPTPAWLTLTSDEEPSPEKYMEYVVSKRGDEMTLVAIQESSLKAESPHGL